MQRFCVVSRWSDSGLLQCNRIGFRGGRRFGPENANSFLDARVKRGGWHIRRSVCFPGNVDPRITRPVHKQESLSPSDRGIFTYRLEIGTPDQIRTGDLHLGRVRPARLFYKYSLDYRYVPTPIGPASFVYNLVIFNKTLIK